MIRVSIFLQVFGEVDCGVDDLDFDRVIERISNGRSFLLIKKYISGFVTVEDLDRRLATNVNLIDKLLVWPYVSHIAAAA